MVVGNIAATIQVINVPARSNTISSLAAVAGIIGETMRSDIDDLVAGVAHNIGYMTSDEARQYFSDYIRQKYGEEKGNQLIAKYFTDQYFGYQSPDIALTTASASDKAKRGPNAFSRDHPYVFTHIVNMLRYGTPGLEGTMDEARKRWNFDTQLLSPQEIFDAFVAYEQNFAKNFSGYKPTITVTDFEEYKKRFPEQAAAIFSEKYFGIPTDPAARKAYFLHHPLGFFTQELVHNIYGVAKKIMATTKQGDYIVIFGNTPYFVGRALQQLIAHQPDNPNYRLLIEFPFSGSPNRVRENNIPLEAGVDVVTADRLRHLQDRLKKVGLIDNPDLANHAVYLVDVVASGGGPAYVLEEIIRHCQQTGARVPDFTIISLNKIDIAQENDTRNAKIAQHSAGDGQTVTLYFPSKENPHFTVDDKVIYLKNHDLLDLLPSDAWRIFPNYNAAYWNTRYDSLLTAPKSKTQSMILEFFDTNLAHEQEQDREKMA